MHCFAYEEASAPCHRASRRFGRWRVAKTICGCSQLGDLYLQVSLSSRVGCIGANGAGKSTLIKILTGELETNDGLVWRHPNCRIAYVAQHAFHHIEKHLDKTPNQYIQWRCALIACLFICFAPSPVALGCSGLMC